MGVNAEKIDLDDLEQKAKASLDETDDQAPRDWDALSPKADKTATLHSELTPAVVLALIGRMRRTEAALRAIRDEGLSRDDARDVAREALDA